MSAEGPPGGPIGLLLSRDLIFTSKVTGTARALGHRIVTVGDAEAAGAAIRRQRPRVVFVDLAAGDLVAPASLRELRSLAGPEVPFVAFGSHVETGALAAAAEAGCDPVLPRSRFVGLLPELIGRLLGGELPDGAPIA